ncbi:MAG: glycosyltransferase family 39 protein [Lachnospiraceae bacterium]|nr:glycosyltransferase family 39 protein [Lachnospiraceae bacterium]
MIALLCMLLPAGITVYLWQKIVAENKLDIKRIGCIYIASALVINILNRMVVKHLIRNEGDIMLQLNQSMGFALKYVFLACVFAAAIPFLFWIDKKESLAGIIRLSEKKYELLWRIAAIIYTVPLFLMNFIRIFDNNFWGDEAYTIKLAKMSFVDMLTATANDVHPPLYYILVMGAYRLLGEHGWVFHVVSMLPYLVVLIFIHTIVWKKFGKIPGLLMITFVSIMANPITYNVEARMYSLSAMFVLLAYYGFYMILENDKKEGYILFIVASLGAAYSHYYAMMSVAVLYGALLLFMVLKKIKPKKLILTYLITIVGYLPWLMAMLTTFERTAEDFWITEADNHTFLAGLLFFYEGDRWYAWLMLGLTVVFLINVILLDKKKNKQLSYNTVWIIWGLAASVGTLVIAELISVLIRPAFLSRYLYPVVAVMWLALCVSITKCKRKRACAIIIMVLTLVTSLPTYRDIYYREKGLDEACTRTHETLQNLMKEGDVIVTTKSHLTWTILDYYMPHIEVREIVPGFQEFDSDTTYWLIWASDLNEDEVKWLADCNYEVVEECHNAMLGYNLFHVYRLINVSPLTDRG